MKEDASGVPREFGARFPLWRTAVPVLEFQFSLIPPSNESHIVAAQR